jgi:hydrogenase-4 component F
VLAIAGLPPFGIFMSEFLLLTTTFARQPGLALLAAFGLVVAFGALVLRLQGMLFGAPSEPSHTVKASSFPFALHLLLVLIAGLFLPTALAAWFQRAAEVMG